MCPKSMPDEPGETFSFTRNSIRTGLFFLPGSFQMQLGSMDAVSHPTPFAKSALIGRDGGSFEDHCGVTQKLIG